MDGDSLHLCGSKHAFLLASHKMLLQNCTFWGNCSLKVFYLLLHSFLTFGAIEKMSEGA